MTQADQYERYMLELINAERAKAGAPPLRLERHLNQSAEDHSEWMLATDRFSHTGAGGSSATQRMKDAGFDFSGTWRSAENIAVQTERGASGIRDDVADLHQSLMNSPGHRANLLDPSLKYIGIGIELGGFDYGSGDYRSVIVTQNFAATGGTVRLDGAASENDRLTGTADVDLLAGGTGNDLLAGRGGNDTLLGGSGQDILRGGSGADVLRGGSGADRLSGGAGRDLVDGGAGRDILWGRAGADTFVFDRGAGTDRIRDFQNDLDRIDLRDFDLAGPRAALDRAERLDGDVVFTFGTGDRLVVEDTTLKALADDLIL